MMPEATIRMATRATGRTGALLLAATIALPVVLMSIGAWSAWRDAWDSARAEVQHAADAVSEYGKRVLSAHLMALGRIDASLGHAGDAEIAARRTELSARLAPVVEHTPGALAAYLLDGQGNVVFSTPADAPALLLDPEMLVPAEAVRIGTPQARPDGAPLLAVVAPRGIADDGPTPPGTLVLTVRTDVLSTHLRRIMTNPDYVAVLLRGDGEVLARSTGLDAPARGATSVATIMGGADRALVELRSPQDGRPRLHAMRRVEGWPVYGIAARPRDEILSQWRATVAGHLAIGLPATAALLLLGFAVQRGQARLIDTNAELEGRVAARTVELAEKEARLRSALEAGRVFALEYDFATDEMIRSANAAEILGLPPDEAIHGTGEDFLARVVPEDRTRLRALLGGLTPQEPRWAVQFRYRRPDGRLVWLHDQGAAQFGPDGRPTRLAFLSRDITAEVEADRAKREAALRLRAAAEGAGIGTYEIDLVRRTAWFDDCAAQTLGGVVPPCNWVQLRDAEWTALDRCVHADDRAAYDAGWRQVAEGRMDEWSAETRMRRPDGSIVWVWCHGIALDRDAIMGRPARIVGIMRDITERRRMQAELRQAQKMQALGEIAGGIAHDVNNVLQAIAGAAGLAERDVADTEAVRRRLRAVSVAVARGAAITDRMLAFARRSERQAEALDPRVLLDGLVELLRPALGPGITILVEAEEGLPPLLADREQLQTALINLATNARDAMPVGGTLTLSAALEEVARDGGQRRPASLVAGTYLRIAVRDTGAGMDGATLALATEPFFTTKPTGRGTGLGLPLVKGLAERSGGGFAIESAPGVGTTVTLWFPRAAEAATEAARPANAPALPRTEACVGRVLVVDDDMLVRETLVEQLEGEGFQVVAAADAAQALALLDRDGRVDALVSDLSMPGMDGIALIAEARRRYPGLPAILLTGMADGTADARILASGPGAVLRKPACGEEIAARLTDLMRRAAA